MVVIWVIDHFRVTQKKKKKEKRKEKKNKKETLPASKIYSKS